MNIEIYENTEDGTQCYVALENGTFAPSSLYTAETVPDTVWSLVKGGSYRGVKHPVAIGELLFVIINEEGHVALSDGEEN